MWSAVLVGAVAVMISGSSSVYAQQREGEGERGPKSGFSNEDRTQAIDARIASRLASLKERLRLTPEQAKNWPAYEAAFQAVAKLHRERMEAGQERPSDPVQRMRQRAEALGVMGAALSRLADAQGPLYSGLDEDQKRQFATLSQMLGIKGICIHARSVMTTVVVGAVRTMTTVAVGATGTLTTVVVGAVGTMATVAAGVAETMTAVAVGAVGTMATVAIGVAGTMTAVVVGVVRMMTTVAVGATAEVARPERQWRSPPLGPR